MPALQVEEEGSTPSLDFADEMFSFCSPGQEANMTNVPAEDGYALGLLVDLRDLCRKIGDTHYRMAAELHDLLRQVANPAVHGLDNELTFRVQQTARGELGETLRTISLNGNAEIARAAFEAAVRCYPQARWLLLWGSYVVEKYEPQDRAHSK
jgi:hypothetical protein